ncbi:MAG UNVERIFIED_CONTAM: hypothetical protein LVR18_25315 [Planctomycetaceae bacterium]
MLQHPVVARCLQFIESSARSDGSWPIDTNLTTWVTTLSVNALQGAADQDWRQRVRCVCRADVVAGPAVSRGVHPYTGAAPGGWSWTDLPGGVPDATISGGHAGVRCICVVRGSGVAQAERESLFRAGDWLLGLQNRDGGWHEDILSGLRVPCPLTAVPAI